MFSHMSVILFTGAFHQFFLCLKEDCWSYPLIGTLYRYIMNDFSSLPSKCHKVSTLYRCCLQSILFRIPDACDPCYRTGRERQSSTCRSWLVGRRSYPESFVLVHPCCCGKPGLLWRIYEWDYRANLIHLWIHFKVLLFRELLKSAIWNLLALEYFSCEYWQMGIHSFYTII